MSARLTSLESEALKLPPDERVRLADHLLASVRPDPEIDDAWEAEVTHRLQAIERGEEVLSPLDVALARVRRTLG